MQQHDYGPNVAEPRLAIRAGREAASSDRALCRAVLDVVKTDASLLAVFTCSNGTLAVRERGEAYGTAAPPDTWLRLDRTLELSGIDRERRPVLLLDPCACSGRVTDLGSAIVQLAAARADEPAVS